MRLLLFLPLFVLTVASPVRAQTLEEVVEGLEGVYAKITDLRAEFTQNAFNRSLGQTIKAEGVVYLKKPGKMRW
ncbi:MAG: outer membrane lipoprotein carrier protein LolA, partial [Candidatus Rokubacteria bacterium]|nr:outer membrane lipoprotein carrier protein LolA [Candidatus Rokubacteria bacterium]